MPQTVIISEEGEQCYYTTAEVPRRGDYCLASAISEVFDGKDWFYRCAIHTGQVKPGVTGKVRYAYTK